MSLTSKNHPAPIPPPPPPSPLLGPDEQQLSRTVPPVDLTFLLSLYHDQCHIYEGFDFGFEDSHPLTTPDANDESLQRYKQSLGLGGGKDLSDPNDPRVCIILSLTMESPGRDPVTIDLKTPGSEKTLKDHPFKIKEGARFTMVASFKVQHEILSGLHYVQVVKRKGIKVSKDSEMIVSLSRIQIALVRHQQ